MLTTIGSSFQVEIAQNIVDQLVRQGYGGNLINQHQLYSHTGNFSQASQGNVSMPPVTGGHPSYTAEGSVNLIWNYDTQQAKSLPQNILDQQTHGCGGNMINQHQQDGRIGNFSQASQGIMSTPHITRSVPSYAAQGAINPISNSYTQQSKSDNDLSKWHPFASSTQVPMDSFMKNDDFQKWNAFESITKRVPVNPFLDTDDLPEWYPSESGPRQVLRNPFLDTDDFPEWNPSKSGPRQVLRNPFLDTDDLPEWNPSESGPRQVLRNPFLDTDDLPEWNPSETGPRQVSRNLSLDTNDLTEWNPRH
ncbi:hypothetical protein LOK49_LG08G02180 [Camellia lanceoleosa]|uniref:Uncharacterized protein n=1 Tax=Camellia lanceoleosa TaxID=1840588 RepID=A0ACC0GQZ7_9ERIC|nr:hypothetical protein LOK49_LG08G02180 [Camellia lanceoleosa]